MRQANRGSSLRVRSDVLVALFACLVTSAVQAQDMRSVYALDCMGCHVEDGTGAAGKVPSMRETLVPFATSPRGRRYLLQVPGVAQSSRTSSELAQLLNWMIRNLSDVPVPTTFVEFTAAEVAAARSKSLQDAAAIRATLMVELAASLPSSRQATQHSTGVEP